MKFRFTLNELARCLGTDTLELLEWEKLGIAERNGTVDAEEEGIVRVFQGGDVFLVLAADRLIKAGLTADEAKEALTQLKEFIGKASHDCILNEIAVKPGKPSRIIATAGVLELSDPGAYIRISWPEFQSHVAHVFPEPYAPEHTGR